MTIRTFDGWVRLDDFCTKHNQKMNVVQKRVHDETWKRGVHYSCPEGSTAYVHEERCLEWLRKRGKL